MADGQRRQYEPHYEPQRERQQGKGEDRLLQQPEADRQRQETRQHGADRHYRWNQEGLQRGSALNRAQAFWKRLRPGFQAGASSGRRR